MATAALVAGLRSSTCHIGWMPRGHGSGVAWTNLVVYHCKCNGTRIGTAKIWFLLELEVLVHFLISLSLSFSTHERLICVTMAPFLQVPDRGLPLLIPVSSMPFV
jgi:hypothetical protein